MVIAAPSATNCRRSSRLRAPPPSRRTAPRHTAHSARDVKRDRSPSIGAWIDGAIPFRAETVRGYAEGLHESWLAAHARPKRPARRSATATIDVRYRYNQDFKSIYAMVPSTIALLLVFIPAVLMAVGVVGEKELGSITNFYATPVTRLEFLLGKQLPYVGIGVSISSSCS